MNQEAYNRTRVRLQCFQLVLTTIQVLATLATFLVVYLK